MSQLKDIFVSEEIKKVVDYLTIGKNIDSISQISGISTVSVSSTVILSDIHNVYLQDGMYVKINNENFKVSNVIKDTSFEIDAVFEVDPTIWALALEYKAGTRIEVNALLKAQMRNPNNNLERFPLLWLIIDGSEQDSFRFEPPINFERTVKLSFINHTKKEYTLEQRRDENIKPSIQPYVSLFVQAIKSTEFRTIFLFEDLEVNNYDRFIRYFYGSADQNIQVFDAPTDAIELVWDLRFANQYKCTLYS